MDRVQRGARARHQRGRLRAWRDLPTPRPASVRGQGVQRVRPASPAGAGHRQDGGRAAPRPSAHPAHRHAARARDARTRPTSADMLDRDLRRLDPDAAVPDHRGLRRLVAASMPSRLRRPSKAAGTGDRAGRRGRTGRRDTRGLRSRAPSTAWADAIAVAGKGLPAAEEPGVLRGGVLRSCAAEPDHGQGGLPQVRRPGRGSRSTAPKRTAVWDVFASYRAIGRIDGRLDFSEVALRPPST